MSAKSIAYGAADPSQLHNLTQTERLGHTNFRAANAGIVLDEINNRFPATYAPIMDRLLRGECTAADVTTINKRVLNTLFRLPDGSFDRLGMRHCWMAQTITFRNKVSGMNLHLTMYAFVCFSTFGLVFHLTFCLRLH